MLFTKMPEFSVVVCVKNEEQRLDACLQGVLLNAPSEIIVVDGNSSDRTALIARKYTDKVIVTENSSLTRDRQIGIDAASHGLVAMIDADHRLLAGDLVSLFEDMQAYSFDVVQAQLISFVNNNYWNRAEEQAWSLTHNIPGPKSMIGVAPAIFNKRIFSMVKFDDTVTRTIDDTDFIYRLSLVPGVKFGIGRTQIRQLHSGTFESYFKKFRWYGVGDGEFCVKHPGRAPGMWFHLLVRYPLVYGFKALCRGKFEVIPFFMLQGYVRFYSMVRKILGMVMSRKGGH